MQTNSAQELLTSEELSLRLKITPATVTNWRRRKIIPAIRINATTYRFCYDDVLSELRKNSVVLNGGVS